MTRSKRGCAHNFAGNDSLPQTYAVHCPCSKGSRVTEIFQVSCAYVQASGLPTSSPSLLDPSLNGMGPEHNLHNHGEPSNRFLSKGLLESMKKRFVEQKLHSAKPRFKVGRRLCTEKCLSAGFTGKLSESLSL